jgi:hypothetical protein
MWQQDSKKIKNIGDSAGILCHGFVKINPMKKKGTGYFFS